MQKREKSNYNLAEMVYIYSKLILLNTNIEGLKF